MVVDGAGANSASGFAVHDRGTQAWPEGHPRSCRVSSDLLV